MKADGSIALLLWMKWQCADFHENAGTGSKQYAGSKRGFIGIYQGQYAFPIHDASKAVIESTIK